MKIAEEEEVRRRWRVESVRRRHNYLPFIVELLKSLASKEQLLPVWHLKRVQSVSLLGSSINNVKLFWIIFNPLRFSVMF